MSRGTPLQETASLHEKAVQAVARGEVPKAPRQARRSTEREHPVYTGVVDKRVILTAKYLIAHGTYTRWEALGPREVLVR